MRRIPVATGVLLLAATVLAATVRVEDAQLRYEVPASWHRVPAPSSMRAAQYRIDGPTDAPDDDAEVVLFYFGAGKGGSTEANLQRWYGQFEQPDGTPSSEAAVTTKRTVHGLTVTSVDLTGTYHPVGMGAGAASKPQPDTRMLAAVIEGPNGPWFLRVVGPSATMQAVAPEFDQVIASLEPHA